MPPIEIPAILEKFGIKAESLEGVKIGQGVVGRSAQVALGAMAVLAVIGCRLSSDFLLLLLGAATIGTVWWFFNAARDFAIRHPELALMEGATLMAYKQVELASKDQPHPPQEQPLIANPSQAVISLPSNTAEK
jgi:hypothetical protein